MTIRSGPIRLGLIGVGKIARDQHLPAIAGDPRFELIATASAQGQVEGVPGYGSIEKMLAASHELDAVVIATPPTVRGAIADAAIGAGLDIMLEKPPAAGLAEVAAMEARAAAAGTVLFASWHSREAAGVEPAREWLADREIRQVRNQLAGRYKAMASGSGLDPRIRRLRRIRSSHQCLFHRHQNSTRSDRGRVGGLRHSFEP